MENVYETEKDLSLKAAEFLTTYLSVASDQILANSLSGVEKANAYLSAIISAQENLISYANGIITTGNSSYIDNYISSINSANELLQQKIYDANVMLDDVSRMDFLGDTGKFLGELGGPLVDGYQIIDGLLKDDTTGVLSNTMGIFASATVVTLAAGTAAPAFAVASAAVVVSYLAGEAFEGAVDLLRDVIDLIHPESIVEDEPSRIVVYSILFELAKNNPDSTLSNNELLDEFVGIFESSSQGTDIDSANSITNNLSSIMGLSFDNSLAGNKLLFDHIHQNNIYLGEIKSLRSLTNEEITFLAEEHSISGTMARYALENLTPFLITNPNPNALSSEIIESDKYAINSHSEAYWGDRVDFLKTHLAANADRNYFSTEVSNDFVYYKEISSGKTAQTFAFADSPMLRIFGSDNGDQIIGASKSDHLYGGAGNDIIQGAGGNDYIEGNQDSDVLIGNDGADEIHGGAGNDFLISNGQDAATDGDVDMLYGDKGNDTFYLNSGDLAFDSEGQDTYIVNTDAGGGRVVIDDTDRKGTLILNGTAIRFALNEAANEWSAWRYRLKQEGTSLIITNDDGADVELKNFSNGDFGIRLEYAEETVPDSSITGTSGNDDISATEDGRNASQDEHIQLLGGDDRVDGQGGSDLIEGGDGFDILQGSEGDDRLYAGINSDYPGVFAEIGEQGGTANDWLSGGDDDDFLVGNRGQNGLAGGAGKDTIVAGGGDDLIFGDSEKVAADSDWYSDSALHYNGSLSGALNPVGSGDDIIFAGSGDDKVWGQAGGDTIYGGKGDDKLEGDMVGGEAGGLGGEFHGTDYIFGEDDNDIVAGNGAGDFLYGGAGDDEIHGDSASALLEGQYHGDDQIRGGTGNDTLVGDGGNDWIYGGADNDHVFGDIAGLDAQFHGNDQLFGDAGADTLVGHGGNDYLVGGTGDDQLYGDMGDLQNTHAGNDTLEGGDGNDTLIGEAGDDTLIGGIGIDFLAGGIGNDIYRFDLGDGAAVNGITDTIDESPMRDSDESNRVVFGSGISLDDISLSVSGYNLAVGYGSNSLYINNGMLGGIEFFEFEGTAVTIDFISFITQNNHQRLDDTLGAADDLALGSTLNDSLHGGGGNDELHGGGGGDWLTGGNGDDQLFGGGGRDVLSGDDGNDIVNGNDGDDILNGGIGNDHLYGGEGNDQLYGGSGDDTLDGGTGNNSLNGGDGNDTYIVALETGQVMTIGDISGQDVLHLTGETPATDYLMNKVGRDLVISGNGSQVTVAEWDSQALETIVLPDGSVLSGESLISAINTAPIPQSIGPVVVEEDSVLSLNLTGAFTDSGDSPLTYAIEGIDGAALPAWLQIENGYLTGTPGNDDVGALALKVIATDSGGLSATNTLNLNVENTNDKPVAKDDYATTSKPSVVLDYSASFDPSVELDVSVDPDDVNDRVRFASVGGQSIVLWSQDDFYFSNSSQPGNSTGWWLQGVDGSGNLTGEAVQLLDSNYDLRQVANVGGKLAVVYQDDSYDQSFEYGGFGRSIYAVTIEPDLTVSEPTLLIEEGAEDQVSDKFTLVDIVDGVFKSIWMSARSYPENKNNSYTAGSSRFGYGGMFFTESGGDGFVSREMEVGSDFYNMAKYTSELISNQDSRSALTGFNVKKLSVDVVVFDHSSEIEDIKEYSLSVADLLFERGHSPSSAVQWNASDFITRYVSENEIAVFVSIYDYANSSSGETFFKLINTEQDFNTQWVSMGPLSDKDIVADVDIIDIGGGRNGFFATYGRRWGSPNITGRLFDFFGTQLGPDIRLGENDSGTEYIPSFITQPGYHRPQEIRDPGAFTNIVDGDIYTAWASKGSGDSYSQDKWISISRISLGELYSNSVSISPLLNDSDPDFLSGNENLTLADASITSGFGDVVVQGNQIIYNSNGAYDYLPEGESKSVLIEYSVVDASGETDTAVVTVEVSGSKNYNDSAAYVKYEPAEGYDYEYPDTGEGDDVVLLDFHGSGDSSGSDGSSGGGSTPSESAVRTVSVSTGGGDDVISVFPAIPSGASGVSSYRVNLNGGGGNDRYIVNPINPFRYRINIRDSFGSNSLEAGRPVNSYRFRLGLGSLKLSFEGSAVEIHLENFDPDNVLGGPRDIDNFVFSDVTYSYEEFVAFGFDLDGTSAGEEVSGTSVDDRITGLEGDDTLIGGKGNDTYYFRPGDGRDTVIDNEGVNTVEILADISIDDVEFSYVGQDLHLAFGDDDSISVANWKGRFASSVSTFVIGGIEYTHSQIAGRIVSGELVQTLGSSGGDTLIGSEARDWLVGLGGQDILEGSDNDDLLDGGSGDDLLSGGAGDDVFVVEGTDQGSDYFDGGDGFDVIIGGDGDDTLGIRTIAGVERIDGGAGLNFVQGSLYADTLDFSTVELLNIDRIEGGVGDDTITGTSGADTIVGGVGGNTLSGGAGDDTFIATNGGFDALDGGEGFDVLLGGDGDDVIGLRGLTSIERIDGGSGFNVLRAGSYYGDNLDFSAVEFLNVNRIEGGFGADVIIGNASVNEYTGGEGNDTITGTSVNDTIIGGTGNNALNGGEGDDTFIATNGGFDALNGGEGFDVLLGGDGDDVIGLRGLTSIERIDGGSGFNVLRAGSYYGDNLDFSAVELLNIDRIEGGFGADVIVGNASVNEYTGGEGDDTITATALNDTITGGTGHNTLNGGEGDDTFIATNGGFDVLDGGEGFDVLLGGDGDDVIGLRGISSIEQIDGGSGFNVLRAGSYYGDNLDFSAVELLNVDRIEGGFGADVIVGNASVNEYTGGEGDDTISGTSVNDTITGGTGGNTLSGGAGDDTFIATNGGFDVLDGGEGFDVLLGGDGDDVIGLRGISSIEQIDGGSGFNVLRAGSYYGDNLDFSAVELLNVDRIEGGFGADVIVGNASVNEYSGGEGDDTITGTSVNDTITGGTGGNTLSGGAGDDTFIATNGGFDVLDGGEGFDVLLGGDGDDVIGLRGISSIEQIDGGSGFNVLRAGSYYGDNLDFSAVDLLNIDRIEGGHGADVIVGNASVNEYSGGEGDDTITGTSVNDTITGGTGGNTLSGGAGDDTFIATNGGFDVLDGGEGFDVLLGGDGDDVIGLRGLNGIERIDGGSGTNVLRAGSYYGDNLDFSAVDLLNIDRIEGGHGADVIVGNASVNEYSGGEGNDTITGSSGNDTIIGGSDNDMLSGNAGSDTYLYLNGDGVDRINNYSATGSLDGEIDQLDFSGIGKSDLWFSRNGDDLIVDLVGSNGMVAIDNWYLHEDYKLDQIRAAEASVTAEGIEQLVAAMAVFGAAQGGELQLTGEQKDQVGVLLASTWKTTN